MQTQKTLELVISPAQSKGAEGGYRLLSAALVAVGISTIAAAVEAVLARSRD